MANRYRLIEKKRVKQGFVVHSLVDHEQERKAKEALEAAGLYGPPVNPIAVAQALGYPVYWNRFQDRRVHGSTSFDKGIVRIDVEERDPVNRRRFTIAHEIGHAVNHLRRDEYSELRDGEYAGLYRTDFVEGEHPTSEVEANDFAGSLLMPAEWVREYWNRLHEVAAMAKAFRVSEQAMRVRLKKIGIVI